jgi:protoheme IX farnesyltransferase
MRLLKPGVMSLVVFSGLIGLLLAPGDIHPLIAAIVVVAIAAGSGGAAAINMAIDHDIDAVMTRTQKRPIPKGLITPADALSFGVIISLLSVATMFLAAGFIPAALLAFAILFYTLAYSLLLKRYTDQNIVIGGLAGALPPLIGWTAVSTEISIHPLLLVLIIFLWTPPHFWALALYRSQDYKKALIPMMPNTRGILSTKKHILFYSILLLPAALSPYFSGLAGTSYALIAFILSSIQIAASYKLLSSEDNDKALSLSRKIFGFSILWLFAILAFLYFDRIALS